MASDTSIFVAKVDSLITSCIARKATMPRAAANSIPTIASSRATVMKDRYTKSNITKITATVVIMIFTTVLSPLVRPSAATAAGPVT